MSAYLSATDIRQSFRVGGETINVLRGITLHVRRGETVFLCGASGAGKTTLLYTLAGLERPAGGRVMIEDVSLYKLDSDSLSRLRNARMGFVFQAYFLLPELTAMENVLLPSMMGGRADRAQALMLLERVGLKDRMHHLPSELSGGEQQRVAIARALINKPGILFADEPTGNLDSRTGESIIELLLSFVREDGCTLVVVTHDANLARHGDRVLHVEDGMISQV